MYICINNSFMGSIFYSYQLSNKTRNLLFAIQSLIYIIYGDMTIIAIVWRSIRILLITFAVVIDYMNIHFLIMYQISTRNKRCNTFSGQIKYFHFTSLFQSFKRRVLFLKQCITFFTL
jgi:hypothetical protein